MIHVTIDDGVPNWLPLVTLVVTVLAAAFTGFAAFAAWRAASSAAEAARQRDVERLVERADDLENVRRSGVAVNRVDSSSPDVAAWRVEWQLKNDSLGEITDVRMTLRIAGADHAGPPARRLRARSSTRFTIAVRLPADDGEPQRPFPMMLTFVDRFGQSWHRLDDERIAVGPLNADDWAEYVSEDVTLSE